jgi:hypothetical protein
MDDLKLEAKTLILGYINLSNLFLKNGHGLILLHNMPIDSIIVSIQLNLSPLLE